MYTNILVTLDGSSVAEQILPQVKELARLTGAEISLLRVVLVHTFPGADPGDAQLEALREAEDYLKGVGEQLKREGLKISIHVRYGHDAGEILDHAKRKEIDLIAMSTHGRTGVGRWVLGSVAERIIRHSPKPVLLVRTTERTA